MKVAEVSEVLLSGAFSVVLPADGTDKRKDLRSQARARVSFHNQVPEAQTIVVGAECVVSIWPLPRFQDRLGSIR